MFAQTLLFLLLALPEFLSTPGFYLTGMGLGFTVFAYFHKLSLDKAAREHQELADKLAAHDKRIRTVEDVDKTAYPRFLEMEKEVKVLTSTVNTHHELRMTGIVNDVGNMRDLFTMKFENHDKDIREIKDCITKLEEKFDKNTDRIIEQITRLNEKIH